MSPMTRNCDLKTTTKGQSRSRGAQQSFVPGARHDQGLMPGLAGESADQSLSRSENHSIAATRSGQRRLAPPGKGGVGTEAMTSNRSA